MASRPRRQRRPTAPPGVGPALLAAKIGRPQLQATSAAEDELAVDQDSMLDLVDHLLNKGVVLQAEVMIGVADVDLVYLRLTALLCAADRLLPSRRRK